MGYDDKLAELNRKIDELEKIIEEIREMCSGGAEYRVMEVIQSLVNPTDSIDEAIKHVTKFRNNLQNARKGTSETKAEP